MQKSPLVFVTFFLSGLAVIISLVCLITESWITSQIEYVSERNFAFSKARYGLFSGTFTLSQPNFNFINYEIKMTCLVIENKCAMLCGYSEESRQQQLRALISGDHIEFDGNCPHIMAWTRMRPIKADPNLIRSVARRQYISATLYISTVCSLIISIIFGSIACVLSMWNTIYPTVEVYLGINAISIYNGFAALLTLLTLCLWGFQFGATLNTNIAILLTIQGLFDSRGLSQLGYSYWLLLPTSLLYLTSIGILIIKQNLHETNSKRYRVDYRTDL